MVRDQRDGTRPNLRAVRPLDAPPRFLFWLVIGLFVLFGISALVGFFMYRSEGRLVSLVPLALMVLVLIPIYTFILAIVFRASLPRLFAVWVLLFFVAIGAIGGIIGVNYYRDQLPPRYQTELITPLPFLRNFLPPTPVGGALPTIAATPDAAAIEQLLGGGAATAASEPDPTATATVAASSTPTQAATQTTAPTAVAVVPTAAPPTPLPTQAPAAEVAQVSISEPMPPSSAFNGGFVYSRQGWNNCGPANVVMALSYYGWQGTQEEAAAYLKPEREDKNVSPGELVRYVNEETQVRGITRMGGNLNMLKWFVSAGFPVIVEVGGPIYEGYDWIGHYRTIVGYDDLAGVFLVYDSWLGAGDDGSGVAVPYAELDLTWQAFNRVFVVVYEPAREGEVQRLLSELVDVERSAEIALETARNEVRANPQDTFAWNNIGVSLTRLGRYEEAALAFDEARRFNLPFRLLWYQFSSFEAYFNVGRYTDVMAQVNSNLNTGGEFVEETHYWMGRVLQAQGDIVGARRAFERALAQNSRFVAAQEALSELG